MKKAIIVLFIILLPCFGCKDKNAEISSDDFYYGGTFESQPIDGDLIVDDHYITFRSPSLYSTDYVFTISENKEVKINGEAIKAMSRDELIRLGAFISLITRLNVNADDIGILGRKLLPEYFKEELHG